MWKAGDCIRQGEVHGTVTAVDGCTVYYWLENGSCGGCLQHRLEEGYRMPRQRKTADEKKAEAAKKESNGLLEAVKFCAGGYNETGETYSTHAMIWGGYISTYNGIVMYGHKIDTTMEALPHYGLLLKALRTTEGGPVTVTQLDRKRIQIKQKGFRTVVPCLDDHTLVSRTAPDAPVAALDSRMREGFEIMRQIVNKRGETVMQSAVFIGNGYMVGCDNHMLGLFWHGLWFPDLVVPADFIEAVLKTPKALVSFGYTPDRSVTFYFDDGSFIRSQLYAEKYPEWQKAAPEHYEGCHQVPDTFFAALNKIEPFLRKDRSFVYGSENLFHTESNPDDGTAVDVPGLLDCPAGLDVDRMLKLEGRITHIDYTHPSRSRFYGENFRGVLSNFLIGDGDYKAGAEPPPYKGPPDPGYDAATFAHTEANGYDEPAPAPAGAWLADTSVGEAADFAPPQPAGEPEYDEVEPAPANGGWV